jgi:nitrite reductase/ring-hydroxylating ferredoxin subunit
VAAGERVICASGALVEGGTGFRFEVRRGGEAVPAFAIRHEGTVRAYLNRCAHIAVELDWQPGQFFDADRNLLICSTHGAEYDPATGRCLGGPCRGAGLVPLAVEEHGGQVVLKEEANG